MALVRHDWGDGLAGNNMTTIKECLILPHPDESKSKRGQLLAIPTENQTKFLFSSAKEEYFVSPRFYISDTGQEVTEIRRGDVKWNPRLSQLVLSRNNRVLKVKAVRK